MTGQGGAGRAGRTSATVIGFLAEASGMGRTNVISNVAWIIAAAGSRVLVVDWSSDPAVEHNYLRPFHAATLPVADVLPDGSALLDGAPAWLAHHSVVQRYEIPRAGRPPAHLDVLTAREDPGTRTAAEEDRTGWAAQWRQIFSALPYDYVLVDAATGTSRAGIARHADLLEIAVLCFLARQRAVVRAGQVADALAGQAPVRIEVIGVALQFDDRDAERALRSRELIGREFGEHQVQFMPYHPYDEYDEALAVLLDDPAEESSLLAAYLRLTAALTGGAVRTLIAPDEDVRERYRRRLGLAAEATAPRLGVLYAAPDRPWADWAQRWLERCGADVVLVPAGAEVPACEGFVLVDSGRPVPSPVPGDVPVVRLGVAAGEAGGNTEDTPDGAAIAPGLVGEGEAAARLLAAFDLFDTGRPAGGRIPYPGDLPRHAYTNLPPRNPAFSGRDAELEALRNSVLRGGAVHHALLGPAGVGKSEIAREYAHRFGADYDLVWWVPAHDLPSARASLLRLAIECGLAEQGDAVRELLARLGSRLLGRWLLVYDNVTGTDDLSGLYPPNATGHLVTTSGALSSTVDTRPITVEAFTGSEGGAQLHAALPGLTRQGASAVAEAVGQLPLALRLATAWLGEAMTATTALGATVEQAGEWSVLELLERLRRDADEPAGDTRAPASVLGVLRAILDTLSHTPFGRLTTELARMCAQLSPEGVSLHLVRSRAFIGQLTAALPGETVLTGDDEEIDCVLWQGVRHGLFDVDWGSSASLVMHRVVAGALAELMTGDELAATRHRTLMTLAEYAPTETAVNRPASAARFAELQRHLFASGALSSDEWAVRRWVVNHARYIYHQGDGPAWTYAAGVIETLRENWQKSFGKQDGLLLRLTGQLANIYRALGRTDEALELNELVLIGQRGLLGNDRRQTLISVRGRGGDLRGQGRFGEAYDEDLLVRERFREILGKDHPESLRAANNLAASAFLVGDTGYALEVELDNYNRHTRLFGDSPGTWFSKARVGVYRRELGEYKDAAQQLEEATQQMRLLGVPDSHPDQLAINWNLGIAERLIGKLPMAKDRHDRTYTAYRSLFGERAPYTLGCLLSLAADHFRLDAADIAAEIAGTCLAGYEEVYADHPFTLLCELDLALYLRAAGRPEDAAKFSAVARDGMRAQLGENHPWSLAASVNHGGLLAARGESDAAVRLVEDTHLSCQEHLGPDHPYALLAAGAWTELRRGTRSGAANGNGELRNVAVVDVPQT